MIYNIVYYYILVFDCDDFDLELGLSSASTAAAIGELGHNELQFFTKTLSNAAIDNEIDGGVHHQQKVAEAEHHVQGHGDVKPEKKSIKNIFWG